MNQQPDKLFREKLEGYNRPAPASAWDKIDAGLQKKNNKGLGLMWKIAASLLLIALITYIAWPTVQEQPKSIATKQDDTEKVKREETTVTPTAEEKPVPLVQATVQPKELVHPIATNKAVKPKEEIQGENIVEEITPSVQENNVALQPEEKNTETLPTAEIKNSDVIAMNTSTPEHTTLVITAKEADEYLNKKELTQATSKDKRPSTLKKLLKKAEDLTSDQDPFGELRQKKNEILALNFKTEKQREQNK